MRTAPTFLLWLVATCVLVSGLRTARADGGVIYIDVSVKFIRDSNGNDPNGSGGAHNFNSDADVQTEIDHGNEVLRRTFRGYRLRVVELARIQPPKPSGETDPDYWFTLDARSNSNVFEAAAKADKTTWKWHESAINIYINDTGSGQCAFVPEECISLGVTIFSVGTLVHELGHFFNLNHTHAGDPPSIPSPFTFDDLTDGDGLAETRTDHAKASADQLSQLLYGKAYAALSAAQKADLDTAYENVMSYHEENELLEGQMDKWTDTANLPARQKYMVGRTWFVDAADPDNHHDGSLADPYKDLVDATISADGTRQDIILLRPGTYTAPSSGIISKPMILRATRKGPATVTKP